MKLRDLAHHLHAALAEAGNSHPNDGEAQWSHVAERASILFRASVAEDGTIQDAAGVPLTASGETPPIPPGPDDPEVRARVAAHERDLRTRAAAEAANAKAIAANPDTVTLDGEEVAPLELGEIATPTTEGDK